MKFKDRYKYPIFLAGMIFLIAGAFLYKFSFLSFEEEEITAVIGTVLFVFSIASSLIK